MNNPTDNRYQPPNSDVTPIDDDQSGSFIDGGQSVMPGNGLSWIGGGWRLFTKSPGIWILNTIILIAISIVLALIPIIGSIASSLLMPVLIGGIMLGCRSLDDDGVLQVEHLFAGFKEKTGTLVMVGLCMLGASIVAIILVFAVAVLMFGTTIFQSMGDEQAMAAMFGEQGLMMILIVILLFLALLIPLAMAYWFAPALVVFHDMDTLSAMRHSFMGCLRNFVPFLLYGIVLLVLGIIALIPCGLGILVVFPLSYASMYTSYKDIYLRQ